MEVLVVYRVLIILGLMLLFGSMVNTTYASRGIDNNNPGNIIKSDIPWKGKVECSDRTFECFDTPANGIRAIYKNLDTYRSKHNLHTIRELITRWAPPHENDTEKYIEFVENYDGSIVEAIIVYENGWGVTSLPLYQSINPRFQPPHEYQEE